MKDGNYYFEYKLYSDWYFKTLVLTISSSSLSMNYWNKNIFSNPEMFI